MNRPNWGFIGAGIGFFGFLSGLLGLAASTRSEPLWWWLAGGSMFIALLMLAWGVLTSWRLGKKDFNETLRRDVKKALRRKRKLTANTPYRSRFVVSSRHTETGASYRKGDPIPLREAERQLSPLPGWEAGCIWGKEPDAGTSPAHKAYWEILEVTGGNRQVMLLLRSRDQVPPPKLTCTVTRSTRFPDDEEAAGVATEFDETTGIEEYETRNHAWYPKDFAGVEFPLSDGWYTARWRGEHRAGVRFLAGTSFRIESGEVTEGCE